MPGHKRRLSSTSIVARRQASPDDRRDDGPQVEEMVDEEWVERRRPLAGARSRDYLDSPEDAVVAKRHIVRFRRPSQDSRRSLRDDIRRRDDDELQSLNSMDRPVDFEEEQERGRYSLEVEDSTTKSRTIDADERDDDRRPASNERGKSSRDQCRVPMEACSHPPVIIVEPHHDDSTHCEHCQFFSGWFCCIPFAIFLLVSLIVAYMCFRSRINKILDDWQRPTTPLPVEYWSTEPMKSIKPESGEREASWF